MRLAAQGQAAKTNLQKILVLQKRVLRLLYFSEPRAHAGSLFISSNILPLQILYAEKVSSIMFDVSCLNAPSNICDLFTKANSKHKYETRFSCQAWIKIKVLFPVLELDFGKQFPTNFVNSPRIFKKTFSWLIALDNENRGWLCWSALSATKNRKICCHDLMHQKLIVL